MKKFPISNIENQGYTKPIRADKKSLQKTVKPPGKDESCSKKQTKVVSLSKNWQNALRPVIVTAQQQPHP